MVVLLARGPPTTTPAHLLLCCRELMVGVLQEDEGQDRQGVLAGLEGRVRPELVGCGPEALLKVGGEGDGSFEVGSVGSQVQLHRARRSSSRFIYTPVATS